jgi:hypothetical protein
VIVNGSDDVVGGRYVCALLLGTMRKAVVALAVLVAVLAVKRPCVSKWLLLTITGPQPGSRLGSGRGLATWL